MTLRDRLSKHRPDTPEATFIVMMWELGGLCRSYQRAMLHSDDVIRRSYLAEARMSLADLITQCKLLAEQLGYDWGGLVKDGEEAFVERMGNIDQWKAG